MKSITVLEKLQEEPNEDNGYKRVDSDAVEIEDLGKVIRFRKPNDFSICISKDELIKYAQVLLNGEAS